jgi:formiminotetrahydrofolate cyclodeaminase
MAVPPGHTAFSWSGGAKSVSEQPIGSFVDQLAAKQSTPGGGAAAAVGAAVGAAAACMAAEYSQRKKDVDSGAAAKAVELISKLANAPFLLAADEDAEAYAELQRSWKDKDMTAAEKSAIEARALAVPVNVVERCHEYVLAVQAFLPLCNPNITSDARVGIHMLAGAARCAFQTALVNSPPPDVRSKLVRLLKDIRTVEDALLDDSPPAAAGPAAATDKGAAKGPAQQPKQTAEEKTAAQAAKDAEKLRAKVIKEGGKKGVEIEGASDMGGLDFFCTTMELPEGDIALLEVTQLT